MTDDEEEKAALYRRQCETMRILLKNHAITKEQYAKSFHDLTVKMGMERISEEFQPDTEKF